MPPTQYLRPILLVGLLSSFAVACDDDPQRRPPPAEPELDAGEPDSGAEDPDEDDDAGAPQPKVFGGLTVDTEADAQVIDLFGQAGHRLWFELSAQQVAEMNAAAGGGGIIWEANMHKKGRPALAPAYLLADAEGSKLAGPDVGIPGFPGPIDPGPGGQEGDIYTPPGAFDPTFADHVVVQDALSQSVADYGKLEVALVGESTSRDFTKREIPNFRVDVNEFQPKLKIGGVEHFRLNNGLVGTIFREHVAHRVFRALGYPALRSTFAFVGNTVWGEGNWVPMVLSEVYKRKFCKDNVALLGGTCVNMWEFVGDAGSETLTEEACQVGSCDNTRMDDLAQRIAENPQGAGFKAALADVVDWQRYHEFQCLGWILATGDDALRNTNNNLIIERETDHKLIWAPYSVDISAGQEWYAEVTLTGTSSLAQGCQKDPACWEDVYAVCEDLIEKFEKLKPEKFIDETVALLTAHEMMRTGDDARAESLHTWYKERAAILRANLPRYRYLPDAEGQCVNDLEACEDGTCGTAEECLERRCNPGSVWCESLLLCQAPSELCPSCEEEAPYYCPPSSECVLDHAACDDACAELMGAEYIFCENGGYCELPMWCGPKPVPPEHPGEPKPL